MDAKEILQHREKLKFKRDLRRNLTPAERVLWEELRRRKLKGTKWRRQENIGRFIADFLCKELRLIVEVDGGVHETQPDYDQLRTKIINEYGYRVLRFQNEEVLSDVSSVLEKISKEIILTQEVSKTRVTPSPAEGEGAGG